ncbi:hypothetical protein, conserved [Trypanosoma brucei gambiense DAL972]|uniref:C3H1-type domain-containing protein n=2 Tax=Trypanosoma brucei TaxID=5691 RepID=D0A2P4_TRYB9|nr:hypothetical protein, conserved [Trypanosoma brucei gambiense DAL972]RHW69029.1 zinc finger protein family member [Trypanosoma brucei equiperdum]CBH15538.1 hypothetical protein, conserved [Trypanosoma brucei gambiense DAL972]|eukprot:XP_011777802.1 hypothetical protein, conserved [Trypanosoma brucei gambiense DAL972]
MYRPTNRCVADVGQGNPPNLQQVMYSGSVPQTAPVQMQLHPHPQSQSHMVMRPQAHTMATAVNSKPKVHVVSRSPPSRSGASQGERSGTVRFVCPRTNTIVCARYNRTVHTRAKLQHGAVICEDYMHKLHCPEGDQCLKVHVAAEHTWNYILPHIGAPQGIFQHGFTVRCFHPSMTEYFNIPSELVYYTKGSMEYIYDYNEHGDNSKKKFVLCEEMINNRICMSGMACEDVHAVMDDFSSVGRNSTHIVDEKLLPLYPRLRPDVVVRVFEQNSTEEYKDYTGDQILVTDGARQYLLALDVEGAIPRKKMQHCAHFRTKHLCRMGSGCNFIHVLQGLVANAEISPRSTSRSDSPTSELSISVRNRPIALRQSGSQVAEMLAEKYGLSRDENSQVGRHASPFVKQPPNEMASLPLCDAGLFQSNTKSQGNAVINSNINGNYNKEYCRNDDLFPCGAADAGDERVTQRNQQGEQIHDGTQPVAVCSRFRQISPPRRNNPYASPVLSQQASPHPRETI